METPTLSIYHNWAADADTSKSPWTSSIITSLNALIPVDWIVSFNPSPTSSPVFPKSAVKTSPAAYPVPPPVTVAATATPSLIVISAVPFLPLPVTAVKATLVNVYPYDPIPEAGVYPTPALVIVKALSTGAVLVPLVVA